LVLGFTAGSFGLGASIRGRDSPALYKLLHRIEKRNQPFEMQEVDRVETRSEARDVGAYLMEGCEEGRYRESGI
jgi:hypothetical protein